ncbi:hypothetical protein DB88DRAFT_503073 [Papiliotrema laurentii]|uniref:Rhodanese domain-containing protein n=1 Tax=Papiliotrema laurentii TaxID=5418 RepID=A0AAD9CS69_PAPLA|nr:hypothetical protein DB88DRAFT_503290 [Papiliotrema laurentii]KAK1920619.1 hypothetical protein DB88DRAFT_503073 [Papiliotrema laurentii]
MNLFRHFCPVLTSQKLPAHSRMSTASSSSVTGGEKWFDKLPKPQSSPKSLGVDEQHSLLHDSSSDSVIVVDVRRTDIEDPMAFLISNAINLPAQTFFHTLPAVIPLFQRYSHVVFHCSSSQGRGPRCAAWYEDALVERKLPVNAYVLSGGIKAWASKYRDEVVPV